MKLGLALPNFGKYADKDFIGEFSVAAEELGYESLWTSEHIVIPESRTGGFGNLFYDPLLTLSYVAAITRTVSLGTSVLVLPYRNPVVLAKMTATLDELSDGRLILGVGAGWLEDEFTALGADFANRGKITDDSIEIIKTLWTDDAPRYDSAFHKFSDIRFLPKPQQRPGPQIWVGGGSVRAMERAAKYGDGWHPVGLTPENLGQALVRLNRLLEKEKRGAREFVISIRKSLEITSRNDLPDSDTLRGDLGKVMAGLDNYRAAGADHIILQLLGGSPAGVIRTMETISEAYLET